MTETPDPQTPPQGDAQAAPVGEGASAATPAEAPTDDTTTEPDPDDLPGDDASLYQPDADPAPNPYTDGPGEQETGL